MNNKIVKNKLELSDFNWKTGFYECNKNKFLSSIKEYNSYYSILSDMFYDYIGTVCSSNIRLGFKSIICYDAGDSALYSINF